MAKHLLPVVANDIPSFKDRLISGVRGGWLVDISEYILHTPKVALMRDYIAERKEIIEYAIAVADRLHYIRLNPTKARAVASALNEWVNKEGHLLRYHM